MGKNGFDLGKFFYNQCVTRTRTTSISTHNPALHFAITEATMKQRGLHLDVWDHRETEP